MTDHVLTARDLTIGYTHGRRTPAVVVEALNVTLRAGELVCLVGPNGAGKSTLMRTLGGMQPALAGDVRLGGDDVFSLDAQDLARRMSVVLTERVEVGNLSAYALVALGRHPYTDWTGRLSEHDEAVVRWAIDAVGARPLAARPVNELSDGERQKIMIARALAQEPLVMLLDEPTAFLDLPNRVEVMRVLRHLAGTTGRAILLSTHDLDLALRSADTIWLLPRGGPLYTGAPEDLVLNGAFEATFRGDGVVFDRQSGAFSIQMPPSGTVTLAGDGLGAVWTRRALERAGFQVRASDNPGEVLARISVCERAGDTIWTINTHGLAQEHATLYAVIACLREAAQQFKED